MQELRIDEIIVAARQQRGGVLPLRSLLECRLNGVKVTDLPRFFERVARPHPDRVGASQLADLRQRLSPRLGAHLHQADVRRHACLAFSCPYAAVDGDRRGMITAETGTPVIYRQTRVGRRGKHFTVLKFRSMGRDAETGNGAQWADVNDPRVTRVGRLMRRTRIDELPQLINVLRGEMSFVGPRPERPEFVAMLTRATAVLCRPAQRQPRHHRLGASAVFLRGDGRTIDEKAGIRPLLRKEPFARVGLADSARDDPRRPVRGGRALGGPRAHARRTGLNASLAMSACRRRLPGPAGAVFLMGTRFSLGSIASSGPKS